MTKEEFLTYLRKPYDFDLRQSFHLFVENLAGSCKIRKGDIYYLDAYLRDKHNHTLKNQAEVVVRNIMERRHAE